MHDPAPVVKISIRENSLKKVPLHLAEFLGAYRLWSEAGKTSFRKVTPKRTEWQLHRLKDLLICCANIGIPAQ
jgi:hypothetical protein